MVLRGLRDLDMVRRLMESAKGSIEARRVKNRMAEYGLKYAMSLYGVLQHKETGKARYARIEVLANNNLKADDVELLYRHFQWWHPVKTYSIWLYDTESKEIVLEFETW